MKPGDLDRNLRRLAELAREMGTLGQLAVSALHDARTALSGGEQAETTGEEEMARESSTAEAREPTSARQRPQVEVVVK